MKDLFVPYEIAKQLKEKGFNEPCISVFRGGSPYFDKMIDGYESDILNNTNFSTNSDLEGFIVNKEREHYWITRPLLHQAFKWLRDNHGMHVEFIPDEETKRWYAIMYNINKMLDTHKIGSFANYEEAEVEALTELLNF